MSPIGYNLIMVKNILFKIMLPVWIFTFFLIPASVSEAQFGGFVTCNGADCSACNLVEMANTIIDWLFGFVFLLFAVQMTIAGFGLVTSGGNTSALSDAKSKFQNAIIGLIIMMSAWLLIDTIMKGLLPDGQLSGWGPWSEVKCQVQVSPTEFVREGTGADAYSVDSDVPRPPVGEGSYNHDQAMTELQKANILVVSTGNCSDASKSNCTSLDGVKQNTIQRITELQKASGDQLIVTGGTETGHANSAYSHANGYKIDLRPTSKLNNYITQNFEKVPGVDNKYKDSNGNTYWRHPPDHWDVTITK